MKGFALGLALKQRQKTTQKSPIMLTNSGVMYLHRRCHETNLMCARAVDK